MVLSRSNILIAFIILVCFAFTLFELQDEYLWSTFSKSLIVPLITIMYFLNAKKKSNLFTWFLVVFSFSELLSFTEYFLDSDLALESYYVVGNIIYIIAYVFLLLDMFKDMDFYAVCKKYKLHLIVLTGLNIYIVFMLSSIEKADFVDVVMLIMELVYNIVMLQLLTFSFLFYLFKDNKKRLIFFVGCLCLVFAELLQVAYFYIIENYVLIFSSSLLFVLAFAFFYYYSRIRFKEPIAKQL